MTKYILAGGYDRQNDRFGSELVKEIRETVDEPVHIVSCFFADPESWQWELRFRDWQPWVQQYFGETVIYDFATPKNLLGHVQQADVIYFHGGDNETLVERMKAYPDIAGHLEGKIVIGSSAGANYLSKKYWTRSKSQVGDGSGLVPVAVMVHYGSLDGGFNGDQPVYWVEAEAKLRGAIDSDTELLRIREGEFAVVEL